MRPSVPTALADSGTNVNLIRPDISLHNERPSTLQAIAASKDGIQATSKGELTLGSDGLKLTGHRAPVNESLIALGDYAEAGYTTVLDKQHGIRITKNSDLLIHYTRPAPIQGTFDRDRL